MWNNQRAGQQHLNQAGHLFERIENPSKKLFEGKQLNNHKGKQMTWRQPESRTPAARLGDKSIATRGDTWIGDSQSRTPPARLGDKRIGIWGDIWIGDSRKAGHHQPDWETNELPQGETNELETARAGHQQPDWETNELPQGETNKCGTIREPDNNIWTKPDTSLRELRTRAKNCLRENNWITTRGNKWLGDSQRAGLQQPDWETNQLPQGKTNELETADSIESRTPPARLGDKWIATSRKQMNWRQPESRTPPARLGDKWSVTRGDKWIGASRKAGHHQPDWETNESLGRHKRHQPDLGDKWVATRQDKWIGDSQSRTPPARLGDKWIATRGDKWIGDSRRAGHHQPDWETNELI